MRLVLFTFVLSIFAVPIVVSAFSQTETPRAIVSDDFTNKRPGSTKRTKGTRKARRTYRLASAPLTRLETDSAFDVLQVGVTIWRLQSAVGVHSNIDRFLEESSRYHSRRVA